MAGGELGKLERHLSSLRAWQQTYSASEAGEISAASFQVLADEVAEAGSELPGVLPTFGAEQLRGRWSPIFGRYDAALVRTWLASAIARLETAVEQARAAPPIEPMDFSFIQDARLRGVLQRDSLELQQVFQAGYWKSAIILAGGAIEAILTGVLLANPETFSAAAAPKKKNDITRWSLDELIRVALELNTVNGAVGRLSHSVREYRNLVHPGREIRENLAFGREEAAIAMEVLKILVRELKTTVADA
ncbi:MAG TPA: hypothetical protein VE959_29355 [Bryobacteraceae bacterium]|nr:hypothetical protein [Bryobacteraceae bacterium]